MNLERAAYKEIPGTTTLSTFEIKLKTNYYSALLSTFNSEETRTWKTICVKCIALSVVFVLLTPVVFRLLPTLY